MINHTFTLTTGSGTTVKGLKETPMLVLGVLSSGMGLGSQIAELDHQLGGVISSEISKRGFQGDLGKHFTLEIEQKALPRTCSCSASAHPTSLTEITRAMKIAVGRAVSFGCNKITIPILPNRQTSTLNLSRAGFYHPPGG